jgi:hypothetical protein
MDVWILPEKHIQKEQIEKIINILCVFNEKSSQVYRS